MQGTSFQTSRRLSIPTLNSGQISPPALLPMCAHSTLHPPCTQAQSFMAEVPFSRFHLMAMNSYPSRHSRKVSSFSLVSSQKCLHWSLALVLPFSKQTSEHPLLFLWPQPLSPTLPGLRSSPGFRADSLAWAAEFFTFCSCLNAKRLLEPPRITC